MKSHSPERQIDTETSRVIATNLSIGPRSFEASRERQRNKPRAVGESAMLIFFWRCLAIGSQPDCNSGAKAMEVRVLSSPHNLKWFVSRHTNRHEWQHGRDVQRGKSKSQGLLPGHPGLI
jgi:hypothetical protein